MIKKIVKFFDKLEDKVRAYMSHYPIVYAFIGGAGVIVFWRAIWRIFDYWETHLGEWGFIFGGPASLFISMIFLLMTGLFVAVFIGDQILISGIRHDKKITEKTEQELNGEYDMVKDIDKRMQRLEKIVLQLQKTEKLEMVEVMKIEKTEKKEEAELSDIEKK